MSFHEVLFPVDISAGATSAPERKTQIVTLQSGFEERNAVWANSRRSFNISTGIKEIADAYEVLAFWEARLGPLYGFRFSDPLDFNSSGPDQGVSALDQQIGVGDAADVTFQLVKVYEDAAGSYTREIRKPVAGTVVIALDGTPQVAGWTVDATTGIVTFTGAPGLGVVVTAGFEFDVPVRFQDDKLDLDVETFELGGATSINLIEIRV